MNKEKRQESFLKLDKLVKQKGITCYVLAKELGYSSTLFSDWKSGKSMPKTDKLLRIAEYLGVTVEELIK